MVPGQRFELRFPGPKPGVLPLDDPGKITINVPRSYVRIPVLSIFLSLRQILTNMLQNPRGLFATTQTKSQTTGQG